MYCNSCGTANPDDAKFCSNCGCRLDITVNSERSQCRMFERPDRVTDGFIPIKMAQDEEHPTMIMLTRALEDKLINKNVKLSVVFFNLFARYLKTRICRSADCAVQGKLKKSEIGSCILAPTLTVGDYYVGYEQYILCSIIPSGTSGVKVCFYTTHSTFANDDEPSGHVKSLLDGFFSKYKYVGLPDSYTKCYEVDINHGWQGMADEIVDVLLRLFGPVHLSSLIYSDYFKDGSVSAGNWPDKTFRDIIAYLANQSRLGAGCWLTKEGSLLFLYPTDNGRSLRVESSLGVEYDKVGNISLSFGKHAETWYVQHGWSYMEEGHADISYYKDFGPQVSVDDIAEEVMSLLTYIAGPYPDNLEIQGTSYDDKKTGSSLFDEIGKVNQVNLNQSGKTQRRRIFLIVLYVFVAIMSIISIIMSM